MQGIGKSRIGLNFLVNYKSSALLIEKKLGPKLHLDDFIYNMSDLEFNEVALCNREAVKKLVKFRT